MPLPVGSQAPDFTIPDHNKKSVSLDSLLKNGPLVLFFYPRDHSAGCTRQACSFRDNYQFLLQRGVSVAGISKDSADKHTSFIERYNLSYPLLVDHKGVVHQQYGCLGLFGTIPRRVTYLIDPDKTIRLTHEDNFRMNSHVQAVLDKLDMGKLNMKQ